MLEKIEKNLLNIFEKLNINKEYCKVSFSNRPELCDYQINTVFNIAKLEHKNPIEVGEEIVEEINKLDNFSHYFSSVEFVKPGFINIKVSDELINEELNDIKANGTIETIKENITCVLDYGGPNIAKPLHVGHLRPALIGQSAYNILKKKGYNVIGDIHLGDIGLQIGEVFYGLKKENINPEDITIEVLDRIYPSISKLCKEDENVLAECRKTTNDLQSVITNIELEDKENYREYYKKICEVSLNDIKRMYKFLNVDFDYWYGERDALNYMDDLFKYFEDRNLIEEDDGAKIVRIAREDDKKTMPPAMLQVKSGAKGYQASDLATIYQRVKDFHPNYMLYFVDGRQSLHFEQVFRACEISGLTKGITLEHDYNGTINGADGKPFKTRSGDTVKLDDLLEDIRKTFLSKKESNKNMKEEDIDKIVRSIICFAELQNNREKNYIFDINKFSDVQGKTGPYILYTALRIRKILNDNNVNNNKIGSTIYNEQDKELRIKLLGANEAVTKAADLRMPHYVAEYLYDLCVVANTFYQNNNINNLKEEDKKNDWLNILDFTYNVIEELLKLLLIDIPSEM